MHHGGGPPNVQRNLQRSRSFTGSEQQPANANHPQSPVTSFAPSASPSAPQSPNYQIIMSRSPVTGQNMNITLQNVGPMVSGNQQITLASLPLQSPASPGFQHQTQQWRFESGSSSYVVTSPLPQTMQPQSPTQHSPVPIQAVPRPSAPGSALGVCGQSPTRFVEAGIMVRQINLGSPPGSSHFVYQDGTGLAQLASTTAGAVQLTSPGTPGAIRERCLSQPHSQTGGTIHHLGPQSPVAAGAALPTLGSPGHITTSNLPPQISSIIQGQLARPMIFEKTAQGVVASFGVPSAIPPSSPSRSNPPQGLANQSLTPTSIKKMQPKKLEEIAPSNPEVAQLRKQCLEHHAKKMESLKEVFKEYLIELFFLQHLQGNMMDYLAFKKKPCVPLFTYLRQNDLDLEDEEEEEEQSEVINDEVKVVTGKDGQTVTPVAIATQLPPNVSAAFSAQQQFQVMEASLLGTISNSVDMEAFKRQQAMAQADQAKRSRMEVGRHGMIFQHPAVTPLGSPGIPLQQLMPTAQGGMPPTPQTVQIGGHKQNQQQYDPSKGPPVQNAASLHTPPPQLPGRLPQGGLPMAGLPLSLSQGQAMVVDQQALVAGGQLQVKVQGAGAVLAPVNPHAQLHLSPAAQSKLTVALVRPGSDSSQPAQRLMSNSLSNPAMSPALLTSLSSLPSSHPSAPVRTSSTGPSLSPAAQSKLAVTNGTTGLKMSNLGQSPVGQNSQECSQDKQAEQAKLESHVHQRIAELRKEGQWSASRLPKLQEACRPKSQWDYLLEEMQWMAADFAQERRWKMAAAKKLVRTCARYHVEKKKMEEREKREEEMRLRHIASTIARGVDYFWSNIEQVHLHTIYTTEVPLDDLVKQYAGAYAEGFEWPQPSSQSEDEDREEADDMDPPLDSPHDAVLIDSLLSMDQYRGAERMAFGPDGKPTKDIAEVAAATDLILPKGSARTTLTSRSSPPALLHGSLREYQQVGVEWLASLHRKNLNGILADETGLGKTVQTVAYFAHLACNQGIWGPHLVVVRTCKLLNWEMEFKRWCPGLKILLYLGSRRQRRYKRSRWCEPNSFHVCVTSYKLLLKDQSHFLRRRWRHLVLDEVQLIKNMTEKHWETIFNIKRLGTMLLVSIQQGYSSSEAQGAIMWTFKPHKMQRATKYNLLFLPVQYGTKPEGHLVPLTSSTTQAPRATAVTAAPTTTLFSTEGGDVVKVAQLVGQGRIAQPETPVTLQFQGNKFTLSPSQLRQLTTGQPLQLQGNILQIVSAPGQPLLRPQGPPMVMPTIPQAVPVQNSSGTPSPATSMPPQATTDMETNAKRAANERNRQLKERLASLFHANERRSSRSVMYGSDLIKSCSVYEGRPPPTFPAPQHSRWSWVGRDSCIRAQQTCVFSCILPAAVAPPPQLYASNPPPSYSLAQKSFRRRLQEVSAPQNAEIRNLACPPVVRFPDVHMLEMDSGKLEALSILLQKLSAENRRVMIFTQMTSMLDILEAFLDHSHLTYVRLDESLSLEERQEQVKRFNRNRQILCTILTNRCCSAMGHVFDADTIVFYDTDLNPSMDMRTQEWCDKIGRSKDIHIYRLESGNSIEEKLLKNGTKDLIREVAAQGMDYTLAFLTQRTIQDLFEVEAGSGEKVEEFVVLHQEPSPSESIPPHVARPYIQALNTIRLKTQQEEETEVDTKSEKVGRQEEMDVEDGVREEASQLEELTAVMEQLTPIERYALHYLEYLHISEDEQVIKERLEAAKRGWEQQQQQKIKVEKEEQMILEDEEDLFTYTREDAYNMEYVFENEDGQTEIMPLWTPPTPPQDDNDIYIDSVICLMYDTAPMPESKLPPVYVRKERKRHMDPSALGRKKKKGHGESVIPPRSLFDKASLLKVRREGKDQKKNFSLKQQAPFAKPLPSLLKPAMEAGQDNPEWLISEDWALLQAVKQLLELPLNLTIVSPAHTPNWDLVSDVVNSCSRIYRSPKQCRNRYENVIILREEGKSKNSRPLRTCQIYTQDDNATQIQLYNNRFELMKIIASKRSPPIKPLLGMNPFQKNPKHASVLAESGISYDKPLPPIQVASQRAERIAKEKKALAEQQRTQQLAQQQQQQTTGAAQPQGAAAQPQATAVAAQAAGVAQPNQPGAAAVPNTTVLTGAIKTAAVGTSIQPATVSGNMIVNTVAGVPPGQFQANKRLASPVMPVSSTAGTATAQVVHTQQRAVPATAAPAEVVAIATGQSMRAVTPVTASAVVSTNLTPGQSQTRTLVASAPGMQFSQSKPLTPAQFQQLQLRQQLQQQQQQTQATSPQIKAVGKPQQVHTFFSMEDVKQKLQMAQQQVATAVAAAQGQQAASTQQPQQIHTTSAATSNPQIAAAPRAGPVLTGTTVTNLQVARLTRVTAPGPIQAQTAQVTLTKPPPVVSVPAVVSSAGVTTLPVTVAGISVAIGQAQKAGGPVVTHPFQVQLLQRQKQQAAAQAAAVQKAAQPQQTQAAVQQKLGTQQAAQTTAQQQQKVTYTATTQLQPGIKTQFFTSIAQPQKPTTTQQIQVRS
uniref:E1A binding protein p400 n=1 Tax=Sinocyclocheilus grahami TaxID=75366 RepID=A0A672TEG3_SINGR